MIGERKTTAPIGAERVKPLDKPKPKMQDLTLVAKAMKFSPRKSVDVNKSTLSNRRISPQMYYQQMYMTGPINYGRLIQSQHVAERPKLVQFKMNLNKMQNEAIQNKDINSEQEIGSNLQKHAFSHPSKDKNVKDAIIMPKIVTAGLQGAGQQNMQSQQNQPKNQLQIDKDGNRTHVKIGAFDALNPLVSQARRESQRTKQGQPTDQSASNKESIGGPAPVQSKPAFKKPLNILAQLIGQKLVKDVMAERDRILRETQELCEMNFEQVQTEKEDFGKKLHITRAIDRIKYLGKNKKTTGGIPEVSPDLFKSIEAKMNPKEGKISTAKKQKKNKSTERQKDTSDNRQTEQNELLSDDGNRRSGTAGFNNIQNPKMPVSRRRRIQGSQTKNNEDIQHVKDQRETVYQKAQPGVISSIERHNATDNKFYNQRSPHQSMGIEWQPIKRRSNLSLSIDQKLQQQHTTGGKFQRKTAAKWLDQSLHDTSGYDDEPYNMIRSGAKFQNMSQSIPFQTYKKFKSRLGALNQLQQKNDTIEHLVNVQSPKTIGENPKEPLNLSKYYKKFGPTIVQRVQPEMSMSLHGPNSSMLEQQENNLTQTSKFVTGPDQDSAMFQSQQKSKFKENCTDIEAMFTDRGTIVAIQGVSPDQSMEIPSDRFKFDSKFNQIALQDQSAFQTGSDLESVEMNKMQKDLGVVLNQSINRTEQSQVRNTEESMGIGHNTQPIVASFREVDTLLDTARLAEISARDRKRAHPRHSNQLNHSHNFSELGSIIPNQHSTRLQMPKTKRDKALQSRNKGSLFENRAINISRDDDNQGSNMNSQLPFYLLELRRIDEEIDLFEIQDFNNQLINPATQLSQFRPKSAERPESSLLKCEDSITSKKMRQDPVSQMLSKIERQTKKQKIYLNALEHVIGIVVKKMKQQTLGNLLNRIVMGVNETQGRQNNYVEQYIKESQHLKEKQNEEFKQLLDKFEQFKKQNSLDVYFEKYLNDQTRKETVENVKELLHKEDDWVDKMQDYFNSLQKYQSSDSTIKLQGFCQEMSAYRQRLQIFEEQNQVVEDVIKEAMQKQPMAPNVYGKEMYKFADRQYNFGVYETGKKVAERLIAYYVKPKADASCNTESMKELQLKLETQVKEQEEQIELMKEEYQFMVHNLQSLKKKIVDVSNAKNSMQQEYEKMYEQNEVFMREKKVMESLQNKLYQQVNNLQDSLREEMQAHLACKEQLKNAYSQINELNEKLEALKTMESQFDDLNYNYKKELSEKLQLASKIVMLQKFYDKYKNAVKNLKIQPGTNASRDQTKGGNISDLESDELNQSKASPDYSLPQRDSINRTQQDRTSPDQATPLTGSRQARAMAGEKSTQRDRGRQVSLVSQDQKRGSDAFNSIDTPKVDNHQAADSQISDGFSASLHKTTAKIDKQLDSIKQSGSHQFENPTISRTKTIQKQPNLTKQKTIVNDKKDQNVRGSQNDADSKVDTIQRDRSQLQEGSQLNQDSLADNYLKPAMIAETKGEQSPDFKISTKVSAHKQQDQLTETVVGSTIHDQQQLDSQILQPISSREHPQIENTGVKRTLVDNQTQTDAYLLINYASDLFLNELKLIIEEELKNNDEGVFQDLLKKAMFIINRIKSKAATAYGIVGGGAIASAILPASTPAIIGQLPMTPSMGNRRQFSPPKSWHFDVSNNAEQSEYQQRQMISQFSGQSKRKTPCNATQKAKQTSPQNKRQLNIGSRGIADKRGTFSNDSNSRFTNMFSSTNDGGPVNKKSLKGRFDSAFNTQAMWPQRTNETFSDNAMIGVKSDAQMDSGSYHMKGNQMNMLLSEQTFKGQEQELSEFARRVALRKSVGESVFDALSPTNEQESNQEGEITKRHRQSDTNDAVSDAYPQLTRQAVHERNAHTAATKQRYQKKQ